jgi:hypothetical protein
MQSSATNACVTRSETVRRLATFPRRRSRPPTATGSLAPGREPPLDAGRFTHDRDTGVTTITDTVPAEADKPDPGPAKPVNETETGTRVAGARRTRKG